MPDLSQYHLADSFKDAISYPKVGETIRGKLILAAWVNKNDALKGYKIQCERCGEISEYVNAGNLKRGASVTCRYCLNAQQSSIWFKQNYDIKTAKNLCAIYCKRHGRRNGPKFHEPWKTDYKAFAECITALDNFDKHPEYETDRIDSSKGYEPGNIRFVTRQDNQNNRAITKFVEFKSTKYPLADFVRLIASKDCLEIYRFIITRVHGATRSLEEVLKELKNQRLSFWRSEQIRQYYLNWYTTNIEE